MKKPNSRNGTGRPVKNFRVGLSRREIELILSSCELELDLDLSSSPLDAVRQWRLKRENFVESFVGRRAMLKDRPDPAGDRAMAERWRAQNDLACGLIEQLSAQLAAAN